MKDIAPKLKKREKLIQRKLNILENILDSGFLDSDLAQRKFENISTGKKILQQTQKMLTLFYKKEIKVHWSQGKNRFNGKMTI